MDGFAFEQIHGMKASATPAPKTSLILSPLGCRSLHVRQKLMLARDNLLLVDPTLFFMAG